MDKACVSCSVNMGRFLSSPRSQAPPGDGLPGTFSVQNVGMPSSDHDGFLVMPWSMLMKMARLAPSASCRSCGMTLGLWTQMELLMLDGNSLAYMFATS